VEIPKPTEDDKALFRSLVPDDPRVEVKPMFGNLGGFVNGNMFMVCSAATSASSWPDPSTNGCWTRRAPARSARPSARWGDT